MEPLSGVKGMQTVDLNVTNAKIFTRGRFVEAGISIEADRIYKIAKAANLPKASETINAGSNVVLPGLIDAHVHLRDLGLKYKEDFFTGTCAAAAGGFTTVLDMPNTVPPTNTPERLKEKIQRAEKQTIINVGFYAALPSQYEQFKEMIENGAIAFKIYLSHPLTELDLRRDDILLEVFKRVKQLNRPVAVHAEDGAEIQRKEEKFRKSGKTRLEHFLKAHTAETEVNAVQRVLNLAKQVGVQLHFCHISAAKSLELVKNAGPQITCEVTPHHLFLTTADLHRQGRIALTDPPVRSPLNAFKLWRGLDEGTTDILASDHAPHALKEKQRENIWEVPPGIPGLETTLPLILTQVNRGQVSWSQLIQLLAVKPAEIFRLNRGSIREGGFADLVIVDAHKEYKIEAEKFHSKAKYSPFDGWKVKGKPIKTFVNGRLIMDEGEIVAKRGTGQIMR